ncbi:hypothetical protein J2780_003266 [Chryseobacterium camelliae]|nr:hypothetical protein [Chryseobacterium camelliae]
MCTSVTLASARGLVSKIIVLIEMGGNTKSFVAVKI